MLNVSVLSSVLLLLQGWVLAQENLNLADPSVCPQNDKILRTNINITNKYLSVFLDGEDALLVPRNCELKFKAPEQHGLMVYVEDSYLRKEGEGGCVDYIQFGIDDIVPFFTLKTSKQMCGEVSDLMYEAGNGVLLFWFYLSRKKQEFLREKFPGVRLKMTITPYSKTQIDKGYEHCSSNDHFIPTSFFCDGAINCPVDAGPNFPQGSRDESESRCAPTTIQPIHPSRPPTIHTEYINIGFESEDLRLGTIISISLGVLVGLACCMVCCVKRCSRVSLPPSPTSEDVCHEMRLSGLPVHSRNHDSTRGGLGGYSYQSGEGAGQISRTPEQLARPEPDSPPPAYTDIFPEGYVYNKEEQADASSAV